MTFNCKIYHDEDNVLHNENYKSLKDMAVGLGLTYQQVADLSSRKDKRKYQEFKYFPKIEIVKIAKKSNRNIKDE